MENETLIIGTTDSKLADIIADHISHRFNLIVEKRDSSNWKGYRLYIDRVDRSEEVIQYVKGFAQGVFFTLTNHIFKL